MTRHILAAVTLAFLTLFSAHSLAFADETESAASIDRSATGGAQMLADILQRQAGQKIDDAFRSENLGETTSSEPSLGPLGGASDPDLWRALRYNKADIRVSTKNETGKILVQDGGMAWLKFRRGPLATYGGWLLLGTLIALCAFYILRGKIKVDEPLTGRTVTRFAFFERFTHWLLAGSFLLLGATGLLSLFGRMFVAPTFGKDANAVILSFSKLVHNNVAWAFILGLILTFLLWVRHNIPNKTDITWFKQAGGIIGKNHPPAKKFNGGQKIIFWSVILFGSVIAVTGVSLLFPFEISIFAKLTPLLNATGLPHLIGMGDLPAALAPQMEMQLTQLFHATLAFVLLAIIIAHIYIGSVGMEGAYDAMGSGEVDEAWAHQHHSIWLDEVKAKSDTKEDSKNPSQPAE